MLESLWVRVACVAAAGGAGALLRWGVSRFSQEYLSDHWPLGTLLVNVIGCFVFGLAYALLKDQAGHAEFLRLVVMTGFAGALTTFSTFAFDTYELALSGSRANPTTAVLWATVNIATHLVLGLAALVAGLVVGRA